jgi:hypothetical protein
MGSKGAQPMGALSQSQGKHLAPKNFYYWELLHL